MQLSKSALSLLFLLGCTNSAAFSVNPSTSKSASRLSASTNKKKNLVGRQNPLRMVASTESVSVADMQRGIGGRLEDAFEAAKEKGEAAFVTFVTAGYPRKEGTLMTVSPSSTRRPHLTEACCYNPFTVTSYSNAFSRQNRHPSHPACYARRRRFGD